jgi:hypothetical protein
LEKESNGKFARQSVYPTRQEATNVLSEIFKNDKNADPQNFKIEEEVIESETEFDKLLDELMERIDHFTSDFTLEARSTTSDGRECVRLVIGDGIDIWTSTAIGAIMEVLGDKATFSIARNPVNNNVEMLIVEAK